VSKTVLYATDFSRPSLAALPHAIAAARERRAELVVLHVLPPPVGPDAMSYVPARMYEEMKDSSCGTPGGGWIFWCHAFRARKYAPGG